MATLEEALVGQGVVTAAQVEEARRLDREIRGGIGLNLLRLRYVTEEDLVEAVRRAVPGIGVATQETLAKASSFALGLVPLTLIERHRAIPVALQGSQLTVAMANPLDTEGIAAIERHTRCRVVPLVAPESIISWALLRYFNLLTPSYAAAGAAGAAAATVSLAEGEADAAAAIPLLRRRRGPVGDTPEDLSQVPVDLAPGRRKSQPPSGPADLAKLEQALARMERQGKRTVQAVPEPVAAAPAPTAPAPAQEPTRVAVPPVPPEPPPYTAPAVKTLPPPPAPAAPAAPPPTAKDAAPPPSGVEVAPPAPPIAAVKIGPAEPRKPATTLPIVARPAPAAPAAKPAAVTPAATKPLGFIPPPQVPPPPAAAQPKPPAAPGAAPAAQTTAARSPAVAKLIVTAAPPGAPEPAAAKTAPTRPIPVVPTATPAAVQQPVVPPERPAAASPPAPPPAPTSAAAPVGGGRQRRTTPKMGLSAPFSPTTPGLPGLVPVTEAAVERLRQRLAGLEDRDAVLASALWTVEEVIGPAAFVARHEQGYKVHRAGKHFRAIFGDGEHALRPGQEPRVDRGFAAEGAQVFPAENFALRPFGRRSVPPNMVVIPVRVAGKTAGVIVAFTEKAAEVMRAETSRYQAIAGAVADRLLAILKKLKQKGK